VSDACCAREDELLRALGRGFVPAELAAHAAACPACAELHGVALALLDDRAAAVAAAGVPSAGTAWWRLQLRHRQEARAAARRSLLVGQGASLVVALALLCALFGTALLGAARHLLALAPVHPVIAVGLVMLLVVVPLGGLVALRQK
jgi:hypothetical protein